MRRYFSADTSSRIVDPIRRAGRIPYSSLPEPHTYPWRSTALTQKTLHPPNKILPWHPLLTTMTPVDPWRIPSVGRACAASATTDACRAARVYCGLCLKAVCLVPRRHGGQGETVEHRSRTASFPPHDDCGVLRLRAYPRGMSRA
jgi:hypothetical protein